MTAKRIMVLALNFCYDRRLAAARVPFTDWEMTNS